MKQDLEGEVIVKDELKITIELINNDNTTTEQQTTVKKYEEYFYISKEKKKVGTATITVKTHNGKTADCIVTVKT